MLNKVKALEKDIGFKKGRGGPSQSCLMILDDVPNKELDKKLKTHAEEYPKLAVFVMDKRKIEMIRIIGDGEVIEVNDTGIAGAILLLCITYHVFELNFPRKYNQLLGYIQHQVLKEKYLGKRSLKFTDLLSNLVSPSKRKRTKESENKASESEESGSEKSIDDEGIDEISVEENVDERVEESGVEGLANKNDKEKQKRGKRARKPKKQVDV